MEEQKPWKISAREVAKLKPQESPYELTDYELPGFTIRIQPSGAMTYYLRYRMKDGQQRKYRIGSTREKTAQQARDDAKDALGKALSGIDPAAEKTQARAETLGEFIDGQY